MQAARVIDGRKYLWDGMEYEDAQEARRVMEGYQAGGFDAGLVQEGERWYVYTRRVVAGASVADAPPV